MFFVQTSTLNSSMRQNFIELSKIFKKLDYWSTMNLSLANIVVICNHVLLSKLWLFMMVWGGSNKMLNKPLGAINNYLLYGKGQLTHTRVSWKECCTKKMFGGFGLCNPKVAHTVATLASFSPLSSIASQL
jgi:hypothetical protein